MTTVPTQLLRPRLRLPGLSGIGTVGQIAAVVIAVAALVAVIGPWIAPHDPEAVDLGSSFAGPSAEHPLGFDGQGRDLLSRLLAGARTSVLGPLVVVAIAMLAGTVLAIAAAWRGGRLDTITGGLFDILFAFPGILLAVLAAAVFGSGLAAASFALAIAYMPYIGRLLRGAALRERNQQYVAALEVQGLSGLLISTRHLLPNVMPLVIAQGTILFGYAMVDLAAISFLGLGVQTPSPDWGVMVFDGRSGVLQSHPSESLFAGLCIVVVVVAVNLLGERLNDRAQEASR
jgi:peptide/nickel transport system permease protein